MKQSGAKVAILQVVVKKDPKGHDKRGTCLSMLVLRSDDVAGCKEYEMGDHTS